MPTYRFQADAGFGGRHQAEVELPDIRAAQVEAIRYVGDLLRDHGPEFWVAEAANLTVTDQAGLILFCLKLSAIRAASIP